MLVYHQVGRGMVFVPKEFIPYHLERWMCQKDGRQIVSRLFGSVQKDGRLAFSATIRNAWSIGHRRVVMTPLRFARICGWILPLRSDTPVYVVADYLADEGQEETAMVRLLQLLAGNLHGEQSHQTRSSQRVQDPSSRDDERT